MEARFKLGAAIGEFRPDQTPDGPYAQAKAMHQMAVNAMAEEVRRKGKIKKRDKNLQRKKEKKRADNVVE